LKVCRLFHQKSYNVSVIYDMQHKLVLLVAYFDKIGALQRK
jgi:hypothetical protein